MPKRDQLLAELAADHYGVLLLAQMGGVPNEIQLMIETAAYDASAEGLRPLHTYIIRALGVREQRLSLGLFASLRFVSDHPLLYHHNAPRTAVHFDGTAADLNALVLDLSQAYVSTFGPWRHLVEMETDFNRSRPLIDLLAGGFGLLGEMPAPLAERVAKVLAHHGVRASLSVDATFTPVDEHGRSRLAQALLIDQSYVIALDFSVEQMTGRQPR
jgi:hypothetical protein